MSLSPSRDSLTFVWSDFLGGEGGPSARTHGLNSSPLATDAAALEAVLHEMEAGQRRSQAESASSKVEPEGLEWQTNGEI